MSNKTSKDSYSEKKNASSSNTSSFDVSKYMIAQESVELFRKNSKGQKGKK